MAAAQQLAQLAIYPTTGVQDAQTAVQHSRALPPVPIANPHATSPAVLHAQPRADVQTTSNQQVLPSRRSEPRAPAPPARPARRAYNELTPLQLRLQEMQKARGVGIFAPGYRRGRGVDGGPTVKQADHPQPQPARQPAPQPTNPPQQPVLTKPDPPPQSVLTKLNPPKQSVLPSINPSQQPVLKKSNAPQQTVQTSANSSNHPVLKAGCEPNPWLKGPMIIGKSTYEQAKNYVIMDGIDERLKKTLRPTPEIDWPWGHGNTSHDALMGPEILEAYEVYHKARRERLEREARCKEEAASKDAEGSKEEAASGNTKRPNDEHYDVQYRRGRNGRWEPDVEKK